MSVYRHRYDINEDSVKSYLARTALNKSRDYIRKNSKHTKVPIQEDMFVAQDECVMKELLNEEIMDKISSCIGKLDEPYRDIARCYYLRGENITSYTKRTGIKLKTAQTRIRRARDKLKILLRKEYGDGY